MKLKIATLKQQIQLLEIRNENHNAAIQTNNTRIMKLRIEIQKAENYPPKPAGKFRGVGISEDTIEKLRKKV